MTAMTRAMMAMVRVFTVTPLSVNGDGRVSHFLATVQLGAR